QAWRAIEPERVEPGMIAVIKQSKNHYQSAMYRLAGVGPGGLAVIAKRCLVQTAAVERLIYEEFLSRMPLPTLGYYGSVDAPDGESCWLFLEEADGDLYSPQNNAHRALAARWLAAVHNTGRHLDWETRLPDRGPKHYWQLLQSCRARVRAHFTNHNLPGFGCVSFLFGGLAHDGRRGADSAIGSLWKMLPSAGQYVVGILCPEVRTARVPDRAHRLPESLRRAPGSGLQGGWMEAL